MGVSAPTASKWFSCVRVCARWGTSAVAAMRYISAADDSKPLNSQLSYSHPAGAGGEGGAADAGQRMLDVLCGASIIHSSSVHTLQVLLKTPSLSIHSSSAGGGGSSWSFVVLFLSCRVLYCCGVLLVVSCRVLFLLCVCVCDLFLFLHLSYSHPAGAGGEGGAADAGQRMLDVLCGAAAKLVRSRAGCFVLGAAFESSAAAAQEQVLLTLGIYKIFVHSKAFLHWSILLVLPRLPALLTRLQYYCTTSGQYATPPPGVLSYAIHYTILVTAISCQGQAHTDLHPSVHVYLSICLPTCLSYPSRHILYPSIYLLRCLATYLLIYLPAYLSSHISIDLPTLPLSRTPGVLQQVLLTQISIRLSMSICLPTYLLIYLPTYLSRHRSIYLPTPPPSRTPGDLHGTHTCLRQQPTWDLDYTRYCHYQ